MKKIVVMIFMSALMLICSGIQVKASVKDDIQNKISKSLSSGEIIKKIYYYDYDNNGRKEAFVITGEKSAFKNYDDTENDLWFAYRENNEIVIKLIRSDVQSQSKVLKLKSVKLFCAITYATTSNPTDVYAVKGNFVENIFSGDSINKYKGDSFTSIHSTYDAAIEGYGHTFKPYWFYYKEGQVYQYKAKEISSKKLKKKYKNAKSVLKKYKKNGKVISILYRSNGLVHINYEKNGSYNNVTFKVKNKKLVKPKTDYGIYLEAM